MNWVEKIIRIWKLKDLRNKILFVFGILVIIRVLAHIPIPGVDIEAVRQLFANDQLLGFLNIFSGGAMSNFSIVALGVGPYITSSIIIQLLTMIVPRIEELSKEGEQGRQKINQWTRILTFPLALIQAYGLIVLLRRGSTIPILTNVSAFQLISILVTLTAGTLFLMWLGELISEKKVGNGISLIIFAGIVANIPTMVQQTRLTYESTQLITILTFLVLSLLITAGVVFITEGQRNIPITYARRNRIGGMLGGVQNHLPLRVNQSGMIPIIFAVSVAMFPSIISQFFLYAKTPAVRNAAQWIMEISQNQVYFGFAYFVLVFAFTFFYTEIIFRPDQIAENLQRQGAFIPGIRPGKNTQDYLQYVSRRIVLAGAIFLGVIAVLPIAAQQLSGIQTFTVGGASLLIVVSVVIETVKQIDAQLSMRDYETI